METLISTELAGKALFSMLSLFFVLHILIMLGLVPHDIVWGGKIKSRQQLLRMEFISLFILAIFTMLVALRMGYLHFLDNPSVIKGSMWVLFAFFVLNTLGNFAAKSPIERYGFGTLTILMSLCCLVLALN
ncbi:hypothetical protein WJR50_15765 [Catalinimonas sp. 4WD22]|uniref:hypothetical protein n=1 Tax=Catalinimonas locisalis TaxID=3133978 RepID=UPI003100FEBA